MAQSALVEGRCEGPDDLRWEWEALRKLVCWEGILSSQNSQDNHLFGTPFLP